MQQISPVHDLLNIRCTDNNILSEIEILDVTGRIVWTEQRNNGAEISISMDRFAEGLYFFRGRTTSGFKTLRFIKTNL